MRDKRALPPLALDPTATPTGLSTVTMNQRRLPSKRHSSYEPPVELSSLGDHVSRINGSPTVSTDSKSGPSTRTVSESSSEKVLRRRSLNTLHFDALQSAVSKLSRIDDFHLEELGYGFFSDVFKVTHKQSGKVMVLKRNKNTNTKLNILREVQLMNRLSHPNILKFMGVCVHEGQLHALTEFINGGDLDQLVQRKGDYLSWKTRIGLAVDTSKGLSYLHSMGIFHRDLTAKNCLVKMTQANHKKRYTAILADLGLAEKIPVTPEERAKLKMVGTPYCMAPEVLCDKRYDERSDLFSFGLIICQLIIRTSTEPEKLPRSNDFGLARDLFLILVKQGVGCPEENTPDTLPTMPPASFLNLAFDCCEVDPLIRPGVKDIIQRLEKAYADEKIKLVEEKRLKAQETVKRHASALAELPPNDPSPLPKMTINTVVSDANKENVRVNIGPLDRLSSEESNDSSGSRRSSGPSLRLSRSFSDVSSELISHAVSMIASSRKRLSGEEVQMDISSVLSSLNEAFMNPFTTLDNPEIQEPKLFDVPSSEVLEMTFDLPPQKLPLGSPSRTRRLRNLNRRRSARPKSLILDIRTETHPTQDEHESETINRLRSASISPKALTPEPAHVVPTFLREDNDICRRGSLPTTPVFSPALPDFNQDTEATDYQCRLKQALLRSVALSPQGCRLLAWWHCHGRSADLRSLTSVLSVMAEKFGKVQGSISMPDLSRDTSNPILNHRIFTPRGSLASVSSDKSSSTQSDQKPPIPTRPPPTHPPYATLPRKSKPRSRSTGNDPGSKRRSRTSDDVFQDPNLLEILHEEAAEARTGHSEAGTLSESEPHPMNPNFIRTGESATVPESQSCFPPQRHEQDVPRLPSKTDGCVSSSSSSSGTSSSGLQMSLQTGIVSSSRRRRQGSFPTTPRLSGSPPPSCYRNRNSRPLTCHDSFPDAVSNPPGNDQTPKMDPWEGDEKRNDLAPSRSNRDSGYEEILSPEHSSGSHFYTDFHRCENLHNNNIRPCVALSLKTAAIVPSVHNETYATAACASCLIATDCNGNEMPLIGDSR